MIHPLPQAVLFCCDHNAVRSPMAEGIMKKFYGTQTYVQSAGVRNDQEIDGFAIAVCAEINVALERHRSRTFDEMVAWGDDLASFDLCVALSPVSHKRACDLGEAFGLTVIYWPIDDPSHLGTTRPQKLDAYRHTRDQIVTALTARWGAPEGLIAT